MKSFSAVEDFHIRTSLMPMYYGFQLRACWNDKKIMTNNYGTIFVAGSLQALLPAAPTAATRTQQRLPLTRFGMMQVD